MEQSAPQESLANGAVKKEKKPRQPKKVEFYFMMQQVMNGLNLCSWHEFEHQFHVVQDVKGIRVIIEEDKGKVCRYIDDEKVTNAILAYCHKYLPMNKDAKLTYEEARSCTKFWKGLTPPINIEEIKPIAEKDEDVRCWHRLNFNLPAVKEETPTFDEMFSRITNAKALKAFIGSIFTPEADRQNYVWLYGQGQNGKSRLVNFLHAMTGPAFSSQQPPGKYGDKFWLSGFLGTRLAVFPDCDDADFVRSGQFKMLTGDDPARIEEKGKPIYTAKLNCRIMISSNDTPNITSQKSDVRRTIFCEMGPLTQDFIPQKQYDDLLLAEASSFLRDCLDTYKELCPHHNPIPVEGQGLQDIIDANEEPFQIFLDKHFVVQKELLKDEKGNTMPARDQWNLSGSKLHELITEDKGFDFRKRAAFINYLKVKHKIERKSVKLEDGRVTKAYIGIRERNPVEKEDHDGKNSSF